MLRASRSSNINSHGIKERKLRLHDVPELSKNVIVLSKVCQGKHDKSARLKDTAAHLSNYEVLDILKGLKSKKTQKSRNQLATITYQTIRCLEETPCKDQTPEKICNFLEAVEAFNLTKSEKLMLLNLCPKTALEIQLIVEDGEDRLSEEEVESLLRVVEEHIGEEEEEQDA